MPEFQIEVSFEVFCGECGAGLCNQTTTRKSRGRGEDQVVVAPCEKCIRDAREEGYEKGLQDGTE